MFEKFQKAVLAVLTVLCASVVLAQIDSIRQSPYDYACYGPTGLISGHQRYDKAQAKCVSEKVGDPSGDYEVRGGAWSIVFSDAFAQSLHTIVPPVGVTGLTSGNELGIFTDRQDDPRNQLHVDEAEIYGADTVPDAFEGCLAIYTENADRGDSSASLVTFTPTQPIQACVWHLDDISLKPTWLASEGFTDYGYSLIRGSGASQQTATAYCDTPSNAARTLGGNRHTTDDGVLTEENYTVSLCPAWRAVVSVAPPSSNAGEYTFGVASYQVDEGGTRESGLAIRANGSDGAASVQSRDAQTGSCVEPDDYTIVTDPQTNSWGDGESGAKAHFQIVAGGVDGQVDGDCTVDFEFNDASATGGIVPGAITTHTVTIRDVTSPSNADYFVSPSGNDSNNGTSTLTPWATCQHAANNVSAGDVVQFRGGVYSNTYNCTLSANGTSGNRIVFENYPGETPILDASHLPQVYATRWSSAVGILRVTGDFVTVQGLEIRESPNFGIRWSGDDGIIDNNHVHDTMLTGIGIDRNANAKRPQVSNNLVHDAFDDDGAGGGGGDADCISFFGTGGGALGSDGIFEDNEMYNCSDDGIDVFQSNNNIIRYNKIYDIGLNNGNGNGIKAGPGVNFQSDNLIYGNTVENCTTGGYDDNLGQGNEYYNNTAVDCANNYRVNSNSTLQNNLCFTGTCSYSFGSFNSWNLGTGNPLFVSTDSANANYLRLTECTSPAIDVGTDVSSETGASSNGDAFDLGAFETTCP